MVYKGCNNDKVELVLKQTSTITGKTKKAAKEALFTVEVIVKSF